MYIFGERVMLYDQGRGSGKCIVYMQDGGEKLNRLNCGKAVKT